MMVIDVRNVHEVLPIGLRFLHQFGREEPSRNGPVLRAAVPVTTIYKKPMERVIFWPQRDANPFFHLYESLWMLCGRNDVAGPSKYVKTFAQYSDDGTTFHGAYGHRWRSHFKTPDRTVQNAESDFERTVPGRTDQLLVIIKALKENPHDRRCVLGMWDPCVDLGRNGKDLPCNLTCTFQVFEGKLNLVVFCRSNDIIWGAYGANAVHFSMLLEYMSRRTGYEVGTYTQISVNYHAYKDIFTKMNSIMYDTAVNPYTTDGCGYPITMPTYHLDEQIRDLVQFADNEDFHKLDCDSCGPWFSAIARVLWAHQCYRDNKNYHDAFAILKHAPHCDWVVAAEQWLMRRQDRTGGVA